MNDAKQQFFNLPTEITLNRLGEPWSESLLNAFFEGIVINNKPINYNNHGTFELLSDLAYRAAPMMLPPAPRAWGWVESKDWETTLKDKFEDMRIDLIEKHKPVIYVKNSAWVYIETVFIPRWNKSMAATYAQVEASEDKICMNWENWPGTIYRNVEAQIEVDSWLDECWEYEKKKMACATSGNGV